MVALGKISGATSSNTAERHKPIYQRETRQTEQQAINEAAKALSALWKLGTTAKP
jgi:hypothetical protein